jgi:hypothetical protein
LPRDALDIHSSVGNSFAVPVVLQIRKGEAVQVIRYSLQLWQMERDVLGGHPSITQLQCVEAMIDAAEAKATSATSATMKKQFEKKLKQAQAERKTLRKVLLGEER